MDSISYSPDALAIFYPFKVEDTSKLAKNEDPMAVTQLDVSDDITSMSTSKGKGGTGSWSITLVSDKNYKRLISPGSWCMLYFGRFSIDVDAPPIGDNVNNGLKMVGIVRSVRRQEAVDPGSGIRQVRYVISGDDFQSIFNTPVYLNQNLAGGGGLISITVANNIASEKMAGDSHSPAQSLRILIKSLMGPIFQESSGNQELIKKNLAMAGGVSKPYRVPSELSTRLIGGKSPQGLYTTMLTFFLTQNLMGKTFPIPDVGGTVPIWGILQAFCHKIFNEIYCELLPVSINGQVRLAPTFVLRPIPFSSDAMKSRFVIKFSDYAKNADIAIRRSQKEFSTKIIKDKNTGKKKKIKVAKPPVSAGKGAHYYVSKTISENEILALNTGKSDAERFNFFFVVPSTIIGNTPAESAMTSDIADKQGGFNSLASSPSLARYGLRPYVTYSNYWLENSDQSAMTLIAKDIWQKAHLFENGIVTIVGCHEHIPVGTNIIFESRGWVAHVEKVDHEFQVRPTGEKSFRTTIAFSRLQTIQGKPIDLTEYGEFDGNLGDWDRSKTKADSDKFKEAAAPKKDSGLGPGTILPAKLDKGTFDV